VKTKSCEAFALDCHRRPGRRANGKRAGKLVGEDGSGLGRMDLVAAARDPVGDKEQTTLGRRKPGGGGVGEEEVGGVHGRRRNTEQGSHKTPKT
jgi:hypothetical protein